MSALRWPLRRARETLRDGGVIAYPTEAVFGLGCDPLEHDAVARIFAIKQRDAAKGFILIAAHIEQLLPFMAPLDKPMRRKLEASWPGPVTWVVPAARDVPAGLAAIATPSRYASPLILSHADCVKSPAWHWFPPAPIVMVGAPARSAVQVRAHLGDEVDYIVPGYHRDTT